MNINMDEIRGPLAGFMAAAMVFASAGTAAAAQNDTQSAATVRTVIQTEINAAGAGKSFASSSSDDTQQTENDLDDAFQL